MTCRAVRKILYPAPERAPEGPGMAEARAHVRECAACRDYFAAAEKWSALLREKSGREEAPALLVEEVVGGIERSPARRSRSWRRILVAALAAAVLPAAWVAYRLPSERFFRALCEDHAHYLDSQSQVRSSDPSALEAWFRERAGFSVRIPSFESGELVGGRLCFLRQRKAALVFYRKNGTPVSLFATDARGLTLGALDRAEIDGVPLRRGSFQGYTVAAFEMRGVLYALVSDLRESELLQWASAAQVKSRGH